jgi:hypothetical protein
LNRHSKLVASASFTTETGAFTTETGETKVSGALPWREECKSSFLASYLTFNFDLSSAFAAFMLFLFCYCFITLFYRKCITAKYKRYKRLATKWNTHH